MDMIHLVNSVNPEILSKGQQMKFAKTVFLLAGIYGLIVLVPQFFLERKIGVDTPPPITHAEFFYGFVCVAVAWQVLFLILSRDPIRYRPMMIPAMLEKIGFPIAVLILYLQGRVAPAIFIPASLDLVLLFLFIAAYRKTPAVDSSRS
jgi:hypothetical protein